MQRRAVRLVVLTLLVAAGAGAAFVTWTNAQTVEALDRTALDVSGRIDRLLVSASEIGSAHAASVAPAHSDRAALDRIPGLINEIRTEAIALSSVVRSDAAPNLLKSVEDAATTLGDSDERARQNLNLGLELMAEDVIFGEARATLATMIDALRQLRTAEAALSASERAAALQKTWLVIGGAAALWLIGLLLLVPASRAREASPATSSVLTLTTEPATEEKPPLTGATVPSIDLTATADLCTAISRLSDASALAPLLGRAASLLDASGIIVWMSAGEELFAVTAHGYDQRVLGRLGPISRTAQNATAAAWRTGALRTVGGDATSSGAIVAPMFGPDQCIGVLAAEVRHGREDDPTARAVTAMVAAQLAAVVAAWPGASAPHQTSPRFEEARA